MYTTITMALAEARQHELRQAAEQRRLMPDTAAAGRSDPIRHLRVTRIALASVRRRFVQAVARG